MNSLHVRLRPCRPLWAGAAVCVLAVSAAATFGFARFASRERGVPTRSLGHIQCVTAHGHSVGDSAPEITWRDASGKTVRLSDFHGKPAVLFLASYTCGPFRVSAGLVEKIWKQFGGRVSCFVVYSTEAHPELAKEAYLHAPSTVADREQAAQKLLADSPLTLPLLVDPLNNPTEKACGSIPSRIVVIDAQGKIAYASGYPSSSMAMPIAGVLEGLLATGDAGTHSATAKQMPPRSYAPPD